VAHFRLGEAYLLQNNFQSAANEFREALNRR
jgi:TolA-binding protein